MFEGLAEEKIISGRRVSRKDAMALIAEGEGLRIEFKRHFSSPEKIAKEMIAFANTKGGTILFGVDDDGSVFGLQSEKSELSEIEHTSQFLCDPGTNALRSSGDHGDLPCQFSHPAFLLSLL